MIDAEHSYFQPAIEQLVLTLQRKYNAVAPADHHETSATRTEALIFGTYQCYLRVSKYAHRKT